VFLYLLLLVLQSITTLNSVGQNPESNHRNVVASCCAWRSSIWLD